MITIKNVNKSFGAHQVLTDVSLEVPKSNVIALNWTKWCRKINANSNN